MNAKDWGHRRKAFSMIRWVILIAISAVSLFPFFMMVMMSTYRAEDIFTGIKFLPGNYFGINLHTVLSGNFLQSVLNSVIAAVVSTAISVNCSAMAGYALTVYRFRFRKTVFRIIMATMAVPPQISMVGYLLEMRVMHFTNTLAPIIVSLFASAFGVYWMTKYMEGGLSKEMVESARIDGCHEFRVFYQIVLPCVVPAVTTLVLLAFIGSWNAYLMPLIFLNRPELATIPIYVQSLRNTYRTDYGAQLAALVLTTIPIIIIFVAGSKSFIKGLTAGAVKG
jgi:multiple sugar transport system permease protein/cellobiose transport system permease protein